MERTDRLRFCHLPLLPTMSFISATFANKSCLTSATSTSTLRYKIIDYSVLMTTILTFSLCLSFLLKVCNLNPMNNPHLHHHHHHSNGNGTATLTIIEPKKESIEIKTETMDEGSNNTHTPPVMSHIHHHMQQHTQHNHQQPQATLAAAHHQILTTNGHIITNFLDLNNHHLHHIDYGKH